MPHEKYIDCIEACNHCANECTHCASECLHDDDVKMMTRCIELDRDCSVLCRTASVLMSGGSRFAADICRLCAEACHACAEECRKHDAEHCQKWRMLATDAPRNARRWQASTRIDGGLEARRDYGAAGRGSRITRLDLTSIVIVEKRESRPLPSRPASPANMGWS